MSIASDRQLNGPGAHVAGGLIQDQDLRGRALDGAQLQGCKLRQVGLAGAQLTGAWLHGGTELDRCVLTRVRLTDARLEGVRLRNSDLFRIDAGNLTLRRATLENCKTTGAIMPGARWAHVTVEEGHTDSMNLSGADLVNVRFANQRLGGCSLTRTNLRGALLVGCDLRNANLYGADFTGALLVGCDFSGAHFDEATLQGAAFIQCQTARVDWGTRPPEAQPHRMGQSRSPGMSDQDWARIHQELDADQGWTPERLRRVLRTLIEEYVLGQGLPTGTPDQALGGDLSGLDFPALIAHLKRTLTVPELGLFQVDGQKVFVDADGPREVSLGRATEPIPERPAPRPAPAAPRPTAGAPTPAASSPAPAEPKAEEAERPKSARPLSQRFKNLEFD